ncbi:MAG: hypothetical protein GWN82_03700, partial [Gemmatimonadetes bacterium]|nr:hypothetical protein [Gemmatimonadota bacterium]NIU29852.1 hypothetical protein [Gemmatimonadota bacterium]NIV60540.1 hypothetical protein [Gemmatimonadota bacterium]NIW62922.1 hypothetical protein [Gemmatimonadota bacterium]
MSSRAENPREDPLSPASGHELEHLLGDPREPGNPLSHARAVALDEAEAYPLEECALLWQHGYLAPATWSHWA